MYSSMPTRPCVKVPGQLGRPATIIVGQPALAIAGFRVRSNQGRVPQSAAACPSRSVRDSTTDLSSPGNNLQLTPISRASPVSHSTQNVEGCSWTCGLCKHRGRDGDSSRVNHITSLTVNPSGELPLHSSSRHNQRMTHLTLYFCPCA